jgi:hypothetical protein
MALQIGINFPQGILQYLQQAKGFVKENVNTLTVSTQEIGESFKQTATHTTDKVIDTVGGALSQTWQTVTIHPGLTSPINNWLMEHPGLLRVVQTFGWAVNHPIISVVVLLFALSLCWSIIKAIARLIEKASWSILQVPIKLFWNLALFSLRSLTQVSTLAIKQLKNPKTTQTIGVLPPSTSEPIHQYKQQRLDEISRRLELIQKEQKELLQEATTIIATDTLETRKV